jgi:CIC family chloride channel protein
VISTWVSNRINASGITARDLLGCAVAAAVSASFNAPIAGALFALEVVLRHLAVHAFAAIAIAGTVINRIEFWGMTEYTLPEGTLLEFYVELPAFLLLGLVSGLVAVAMMKAIFWAEDVGNRLQTRTGLPRYLRPAAAGALLGAIAIPFPHIIGVGGETTAAAIEGTLLLREARRLRGREGRGRRDHHGRADGGRCLLALAHGGCADRACLRSHRDGGAP